ncbi:MAG: Gfo/Idh/MocA family protein [Chloroflexota bacterium]
MAQDGALGVGIVGSGFMGSTWAEVAAHHAAGTRVVAVTGGLRAAGLAARVGIPEDPDLATLCARPEVRIVVLASPPDVHHAQALEALAAGKDLLIEKPMAQSVAECRAIAEAAERAGRRVAVVSHQRFRTVPRAAHAAIAGGAIGPVRMVGTIGAEVGWWDMEARGDTWKLDPRRQTAYASWAAHTCDLVRWLTGSEAVRASAEIANFSGTPPEVGQSAMVLYTMASGALVSVWMSYEFPAPGLDPAWPWHLVGATGIVRFDPYHAAFLDDASGRREIAAQPAFDPLDAADPVRLRAYAAQLEDLVGAIRDGRDPEVSARDGLRTIAMIEAAERSAATHRTIAIAPDGTPEPA